MGAGSSKEIGEIRRLFNSARIKSSMSILASASAESAAVGGLRESPSAALYFRPRTC